MKDKYQGYYKSKGSNNFYQVIDKNILPRWRDVFIYFCIKDKWKRSRTTETVDYLRLHCERISESEFKKFIK